MEGKDRVAIKFYGSWECLVFIDHYQYLVVKVQLRYFGSITNQHPFGNGCRRVMIASQSRHWLRGQAVKTSPFHGGNTGSIPVGVIINLHSSIAQW